MINVYSLSTKQDLKAISVSIVIRDPFLCISGMSVSGIRIKPGSILCNYSHYGPRCFLSRLYLIFLKTDLQMPNNLNQVRALASLSVSIGEIESSKRTWFCFEKPICNSFASDRTNACRTRI